MSVPQTDYEVPARFAPGRNIQLCHQREQHRRPGAIRTRACSLGRSCPVPWTTGRGDAPGNRTQRRRVCNPPPAPARRASWCFRPESNRVAVLRRDSSKSVTGSRVRRGGLEPPGEMPDLRSGAVAAAPPTLGVTSQDRTGSLRDHSPALCRLSYSHRAQRRNRTSVPWVWTRCSPIELAEPACSQEDSNLHRQLRRLA